MNNEYRSYVIVIIILETLICIINCKEKFPKTLQILIVNNILSQSILLLTNKR